MKLAICDDDEREISLLKEQLTEYQRSLGADSIMYKAYQDQRLLIDEWEEQGYDAAILDIMMPEIDGIELGKRIKEKWPDAIIIYLTSSRDFALDAYDIHAERYIIKPVSRNKLFEALDYVLRTKSKVSKNYTLKTPEGTMVLKQDQIMFIEMSSRKMIVHMADGQKITSIYLRSTFSETVQELLDTNSFVMTHKSFIANMSYIKSYSSSNLVLRADKDSADVYVPISRQHTVSVKQSYLQFMARGQEE